MNDEVDRAGGGWGLALDAADAEARAPDDRNLRVLLFELADRRFGFSLRAVAEVLPMVAITPVPGAPEWLAGAINLRGRALPVIDLRRRLALPPIEMDLQAAIVVTEPSARDPVGFIVDRVLEMIALSTDAVDPVDVLGGEEHPVEAFARVEDRMVAILDVERLTSGAPDLVLPEDFG